MGREAYRFDSEDEVSYYAPESFISGIITLWAIMHLFIVKGNEVNLDDIAVLIPCFNEALTVKKVIQDWQKEIPEAKIYVYDNNSTDNTAQIAEEAGAIVRYEYRQGKGNVIRSMFNDIDARCYIMIDGDNTYPAESGREISKLVLEGKADMVIGDRLSSTYFQENKRPFHNFGNVIVKNLINFIFGSNVRDIMTGYRAMSYDFVKSFPVVSQGFEIETEMTIHAIDKNMLLRNETVKYIDREEGSVSKLNTFSDGFRVIRTILHLFCDYRPFYFFSIIAILLSLLSALFFIPVFNDYLHTGIVPRFPTLIICGFVALSALISFFSGIILQTIKHNERREFEFRLKEVREWYKTKGEA